MNDYIDNPFMVYSDNPAEVAVKLWKSRFDIPVGDIASVTFGYSIAIHRLSETEFLLVVSNLGHVEITKITDAIRQHVGV